MLEFININLDNREPEYFYRVNEFVTTMESNPGKNRPFWHSEDFKRGDLLSCRADAIKWYKEREAARQLRDDCQVKGVPFFFKQIDKVQDIPADLMVREFPNYSLEQIAA